MGAVAAAAPSHSSFPAQASCVQYRLVVRDASSLQILQLFTCVDQIQHVEWSADSLFLLCAMYRRGLVQVRCGAGWAASRREPSVAALTCAPAWGGAAPRGFL